jgi:WW domain binding protein 11
MAKDKDRSINPAQQQRKLDKAKALKKGKAEAQARRNEKLGRRNPDRLQKQIDDLKALEAAGDIKPREKQILADLERDLRAVQKAREALGERAPQYGKRESSQHVIKESNDNKGNILGKRRHDGERKPLHQNTIHQDESSGSETDESIRRIPMPKDTPPPIPHAYRRTNHNRPVNANANMEPLGEGPGGGERQPQPNAHTLPPKPIIEARTIYSSAPLIRDLKREAVERFVPTVVRRKQEAARGVGGHLVEPEEMDRLEAEGYVAAPQHQEKREKGGSGVDHEAEARRLAEEEARFLQELEMQEMDGEGEDGGNVPGVSAGSRHRVEIEEVEDEDM